MLESNQWDSNLHPYEALNVMLPLIFIKIRLINTIAMATLTVQDLRDPQIYTIDRLRQISSQSHLLQWTYLQRVDIEIMDRQGLERVQQEVRKLDQNDQLERTFAKLILTIIEARRKRLDLRHPEGKIDIAKKKVKEFAKNFKKYCQVPSVWTCKHAFSSITRNLRNQKERQREEPYVPDEEQTQFLNKAKLTGKLQEK